MRWAILGIHTTSGQTDDERAAFLKAHPHGAARMRFFTGPDRKVNFVDEDVSLPPLLTGMPQSLEFYQAMLTADLNARAKELGG